MMDFATIWQAIMDNLIYIGLFAVVVALLVQNYRRKKAAQKEEKQTPQQLPEHKVTSFDTIFLENGFTAANIMDTDKLSILKRRLATKVAELEQKTAMYMKAKERYQELIVLEQGLRQHIDLLQKEKQDYEIQIAKLETPAGAQV